MEWNYLSILKFQWYKGLGVDKWLHPTLCNWFNYLSMLGLKLIDVSKSSCNYRSIRNLNGGSDKPPLKFGYWCFPGVCNFDSNLNALVNINVQRATGSDICQGTMGPYRISTRSVCHQSGVTGDDDDYDEMIVVMIIVVVVLQISCSLCGKQSTFGCC